VVKALGIEGEISREIRRRIFSGTVFLTSSWPVDAVAVGNLPVLFGATASLSTDGSGIIALSAF
jgi:hypothetical protein